MTIESCLQAVAKKLQHATLKCQSNKEKILLYYLSRPISYCEKIIRVFGAFSEVVIIKLGWNIFSKHRSYIGLLSLTIVPS